MNKLPYLSFHKTAADKFLSLCAHTCQSSPVKQTSYFSNSHHVVTGAYCFLLDDSKGRWHNAHHALDREKKCFSNAGPPSQVSGSALMDVLEEVYKPHYGITNVTVVLKARCVRSPRVSTHDTWNSFRRTALSHFHKNAVGEKMNLQNTHSQWYSHLSAHGPVCDETPRWDSRYWRVMIVVKSKALSKISSFVLFVLFLTSNFELDWRAWGKPGGRKEGR